MASSETVASLDDEAQDGVNHIITIPCYIAS
jgi:hypothetical protein